MLFLVVDDDTLSRELLKLLLEAEGHEVEAVMSGEAAVLRVGARAASRDRGGTDLLSLPDVILADIQMPGISGKELAKALRAQFGNRVPREPPAVPRGKPLLLAMSGSQPVPSELAGFDGFLLKPFTMAELSSIIERTVRQAAPVLEPRVDAAPEQPGKSMAAAEVSSADHSGELGAPLPHALDEDIYKTMRDLMPVAQLGQMYTLCVDDARRRIARMGALAAERDDAEYRKEAHAVKGGSGMIGAAELYQLAAAAEQSGLEAGAPGTGTTGVTATLKRLSLACDRLERILQERTRE